MPKRIALRLQQASQYHRKKPNRKLVKLSRRAGKGPLPEIRLFHSRIAHEFFAGAGHDDAAALQHVPA